MIQVDQGGAYEYVEFKFTTPRSRPLVLLQDGDVLLHVSVEPGEDNTKVCCGAVLRRKNDQRDQPEVLVEDDNG